MLRRAVLTAVVLLTVASAAVHATIVVRRSLTEVEGFATEILVGTVRSLRSVEGFRGWPFTEVTFGDLEVLKGEIPGATVSYRFAGGTKDGRTMVIVGLPQFEEGRRYVLFTNAKRDRLCPLVGWHQGRYRIRDDGLGDSDGRPVYAIEDGFPVLEPPREGARPMAVSAFLDVVREIMRRRDHTAEDPGEER
jgi:hypothetical protein